MKENIEKIIAISSSPSKGRNSDTMLDNFIAGFKEKTQNKIEVDKVYLNDVYFENYCYENKSGPTENEKDFSKLIDKIQKYDGIIIATPTYNFSVPAKLKNLIDRMRPISLDMTKKNIIGQPVGKLKNKKMFFLVSGGTPDWVHFLIFFLFPDFWLKTVFAYYGILRTKSIYIGDINTFKNPKKLKRCFIAGEKFAKKFL